MSVSTHALCRLLHPPRTHDLNTSGPKLPPAEPKTMLHRLAVHLIATNTA